MLLSVFNTVGSYILMLINKVFLKVVFIEAKLDLVLLNDYFLELERVSRYTSSVEIKFSKDQ